MIPPQSPRLPPPPDTPAPEQRLEMDEEKNLAMNPRTSRRNRVIAVAFAVGLTLFLLFSVRPFASSPPPSRGGSPLPVQDALDRPSAPAPGLDKVAASRELVPLEAHIMSKCPDARDCLRDMILPTMMRVQDKVNFTLSFIGTPTENDGVECRHGPAECMGNILELCAAKLYPDPKTSLGFTMCITRRYREIPDRALIEDCALEHAIDIKKLNDCAAKDDGAYGMKMLRDSVRRTADVGLQPRDFLPHARACVLDFRSTNKSALLPGRCDAELHRSAQQRELLHQG